MRSEMPGESLVKSVDAQEDREKGKPMILAAEAFRWGTPMACEKAHSPRPVDHGIQLANQVDQWQTAIPPDSPKTRRQVGATEREDLLPAQAENWQTPHGMGNEDESGKKGGAGGGEFALQANSWPTPNASPEAPNSGTTRANGRQAQRLTDQCLSRVAEGVTATNFPSSLPAPATSTDGDDCLSEGQTSPRQWSTPQVAMLGSVEVNVKRMEKLKAEGRQTGGIRNLRNDVGEDKKRRLNPQFVAYLMGWPERWSIARSGCGCSETALSLWKQRMRSCLLRLCCSMSDAPKK